MRIEIRDILGIHAAELEVGPGEVVEVVGPNAGGKTSIATACQALLAREPNPLHYTVAEMRQYVREGGGEGRAILERGDGEDSVEWVPTRSEGAITALASVDEQSHPMAVGLVDFTARMAAKTRAGLLQPILLPDPATVLEQLREDLQPYLPVRDLEGVLSEVGKRGWEAAATIFEDRMRRAKREWCETTGRGRFGSQVAADWRPGRVDGRSRQAHRGGGGPAGGGGPRRARRAPARGGDRGRRSCSPPRRPGRNCRR